MNGIDLIEIVAIIGIIVMLARMVRNDIISAQAANAEVLRDARIKARTEALREVEQEAESYEIRSKDAIRSAVWAIQRRERTMSAAGAVMQPVEGQS
jgi:hypothetical protein